MHHLHGSQNLGPCIQRGEASYYWEWIHGQNQNLEVRKLSLLTMQNLPFTDRAHYMMSFKMSNVVRMRDRVVSVEILIILWYKSALNWLWQKAEQFDDIFFVVVDVAE